MPGIKCPACQTVDEYASHGGGPGKGDDRWERRKKCKKCGAIFVTLEIPIGLLEEGSAPVPVQPAEPVQLATPVQPVQPVQPVVQSATQPVQLNSIFNTQS